MRCIEITGSDDRMDCRDMFNGPINELPAKCPKCGFPDLDFVPKPYLLVRSKTLTPNELAMAANGNFLVRERIRQVLELIAPGQCTYYQTHFKGSSDSTPWFLAVPTKKVITAKVKASIRCCKTCQEPFSAHPGSQYSEWLFSPQADGKRGRGWTGESEFDVLKSSTWGSCTEGWNKWISRNLFISVRLLDLLKRVKAKGFYEATCGKPTAPDKDESAWVEERLERIKSHGIRLHPAGTLSQKDDKWFRGYLKSLSHAPKSPSDIKSVERRLRLKLPKSYADFITKIGPLSFDGVDNNQSTAVQMTTVDELDFTTYRRGTLQSDDEESQAIDGLMFARASDGDCFCFNIDKGRKEYAVFVYRHEFNHFEPYADSFVTCLQRFVGDQS